MEKKTLPAIKVAEEILRLATTISDEEIKEALSKLRQVEGTWGLLWGLGDIRKSGMDLDFYMLKQKVLEFVEDLHKDKHFHLAAITLIRPLEKPQP